MSTFRLLAVAVLAALSLTQAPLRAQKLEDVVTIKRDVDYVGNGNPRQMLDLYLPKKESAGPRPWLVFIHGGGWVGGNRGDMAVAAAPLLAEGKFIGATVGYRMSSEAIWPAQIHDCKAAIRWLRANAKTYGADPERIAVFGISAGGHLVSLLGTSGGVKELEGDLGPHRDVKSDVQAVINFCGPANFLSFPNDKVDVKPDDEKGLMSLLLGGPRNKRLAEAKSASPVFYVTKDDPPFLHIHGSEDNLVPLSQAEEFDFTLRATGVSSLLLVGRGAGHVFVSEDLFNRMRLFLDKTLLKANVSFPEGPLEVK